MRRAVFDVVLEPVLNRLRRIHGEQVELEGLTSKLSGAGVQRAGRRRMRCTSQIVPNGVRSLERFGSVANFKVAKARPVVRIANKSQNVT